MAYPSYTAMYRAPVLSIHMKYRANSTGVVGTLIGVGFDGMESFELGPYDGLLPLTDAIRLVSADMVMGVLADMRQRIDATVAVEMVSDRMDI